MINKNVKITLSNSFHGTSINVIVPWYVARDGPWTWLQTQADGGCLRAKAKVRRIETKLCGAHGCTCGTVRP